MPSPLGALIRSTRQQKQMGLRELARAIEKSPAFITRLENEDVFPAVSADTLKSIAAVLGMDVDILLVGAGRTKEVQPTTELELALYRRVQSLPKAEQEELLQKLNTKPTLDK